jgi:hypothetical protein
MIEIFEGFMNSWFATYFLFPVSGLVAGSYLFFWIMNPWR